MDEEIQLLGLNCWHILARIGIFFPLQVRSPASGMARGLYVGPPLLLIDFHWCLGAALSLAFFRPDIFG